MGLLNRGFFIGVLVGVAIGASAILGGLAIYRATESPPIIVGPAVGSLRTPAFPADPTPDMDWRLRRLDGGELTLADFREDVLFINNWATWCGPCVREMPTIENLAERFRGADLAFVIVSDEPLDKVRAFVDRQGWRLPIYVTDARPAFLQTRRLPSTFVLDHSRQTIFSHVGGARWDSEAAVDYFDKLLRG